MKYNVGSAMLAFAAIFATGVNASADDDLTDSQKVVAEYFAQEEKRLNTKLPLKVNDWLTLISAKADAAVLRYTYEFPSGTNIDPGALSRNVYKSACSDPGKRLIIDDGGSYFYIFQSNNLDDMISVSVDENKCKAFYDK